MFVFELLVSRSFLQNYEELQASHGMICRYLTMSNVRYYLDYKGEILKELENFPQVLFLMHQWFCPSSTEFASLFITQFNECSESLAPCHEPSCLCHGCYPAASSGDGLRFYASPTFTSSKITISSGNLSVTGTSSPVARAKKILLKGTSAHLGNSGDDCFQQTSQEGRFQQQLVSRCRTMRYRASVCQSLRLNHSHARHYV